MNRQMLKRAEGKRLRLRPFARGAHGQPLDDDWTIALNADADYATLTNTRSGQKVVIGFDHVYSYTSDPAQCDNCGFLTMLSEIQTTPEGQMTAEPIPPRAAGTVQPQLNPLIIEDGSVQWRITWRGRDSTLHALPEDTPRQLLHSFKVVCDTIRRDSSREPQFDRRDDIRHEIVWGLTPTLGRSICCSAGWTVRPRNRCWS